jgi:tellurite resistance protein TehA-like permease
MTSASVLIVLVVGTVVGALIGLLIGGSIDAWYLALLAGFLASILAAIVRSLILARGAGIGPDDRHLPVLVTVYAAVASLGAGSLALEIAERSGLATTPVWIGALAGLFASVLLAILMVTYYTNPGQPPKLAKRH